MKKKVIGAALATLSIAAGMTSLAAAPAHAAGDGKVTSSTRLTVRYAPTVHSRAIGSFAPGKVIPLSCKVTGTSVDGNRVWYLLPGDGGGWVASRYVKVLDPEQAPALCGTNDEVVGKPRTTVNLRLGPNTADAKAGTRTTGDRLHITCKLRAQNVDGNTTWFWLGSGKWVSARYVTVSQTPNHCVEF